MTTHSAKRLLSKARSGPFSDLMRLSRRVEELKAGDGTKPDMRSLLALLDELTAVTDTLKSQRQDIRTQLVELQRGSAAVDAYRRAVHLGSGHETGERK